MSAAAFTTLQPLGYIEDHRFGVFGEQRNQGLELSVFGMPMHGMRVLGGLTLLDAEQRRTQDAVNQGKDAIGLPRTQLNLGASYGTRFMDRDLTLRARMDNALERNYWASAGGYPGYGYLVLAAPRTVALSATVDF